MIRIERSIRQATRLAVALTVLVVIGGTAGVVTADSVGPTDVSSQPAQEVPNAVVSSDSDIQAQTAGSTSVRLTPTTPTIASGDTQQFDIVVSDADGGVGAITATISVENTDIASIDDVTLKANPGVETVDVESDGSEVFVRAALMDSDDSGAVTIGTVTVSGTDQGSTGLELDVESLGDEDGDPYTIGATPGSEISVEGTAEPTALTVSADESTVEPGDRVEYTVRRADTDALVSATVHVDGEAFETGIDGVATVRITDEMGSDAGTITAFASKKATDRESFRNDSVTIDIGNEETSIATVEPPETATPEADDGDEPQIPVETPENETPEPDDSDGPRITLQPAGTSISVNETVDWRLVATGVDGGVGAVGAQVAFEPTGPARITGVELAGDAGVEQTEIQSDGDTAVIRGALMDTNDTGIAHIATLTVEGVESGTAKAVVSADSLGDEDGNSYDIGSTPSATLTVGSADGSTSNGTSTVVLDLSEMPNGFGTASVTVRTAMDASVTDTQAELVPDSQLRVVSDGPRSTTVQAADLAGKVNALSESRTIARLSYNRNLSAEDISIEVGKLENDDGDAVSGDRISAAVSDGRLFGEPLPGADTGSPPSDPDDDGLYEDIDGDGEATFDDAVALSFVDTTKLSSEQVAALDFDGDGDLDMDDAVASAFQ